MNSGIYLFYFFLAWSQVPVLIPMDLMVEASPRRVFANAHTYHINSVSVNSDNETYLSADDLRINLWHLEITDRSFSIPKWRRPQNRTGCLKPKQAFGSFPEKWHKSTLTHLTIQILLTSSQPTWRSSRRSSQQQSSILTSVTRSSTAAAKEPSACVTWEVQLCVTNTPNVSFLEPPVRY